jgi:hypothetical protein
MVIRKKILVSLVVGIISMQLMGCSELETLKSKVFKETDSVQTTKEMPQLTKELMNNYNAVADAAEAKLPSDADATTKYNARFEAVYNEVFAEEADALSKTINVDEDELQDYMANRVHKKPVKVVVVYSKDGKSTYDYRLSDDNPYASQDIGDTFLGAKVKEVRDATDDDIRLQAIDDLSSTKLVERVTERAKEVLSIKNRDVKIDDSSSK